MILKTPGFWVGVELDDPRGGCDGEVTLSDGTKKRLFKTDENRGIILREDGLAKHGEAATTLISSPPPPKGAEYDLLMDESFQCKSPKSNQVITLDPITFQILYYSLALAQDKHIFPKLSSIHEDRAPYVQTTYNDLHPIH